MLCRSLKSALFAAMFLTSVSMFGQGANGTITGTVTDQSGGSLPGATVTVTDVDRGVNRTLTTDAAGAYSAANLIPGNYKVRAEFKGFKTLERSNITIEVAQELKLDLTMQPGDQTQVVNVTETIPLIETSNAELGGTIQNQVINDLPLNGRNYQNLLSLRPGVTVYAGGGGWTQSTNGLRPHDNMYSVEGINSNDPWMAQSVMNAGMAAGDAGTILPIDAIDEFKTNQNPRAEYGWKPGAVVNVGLKSGTNAFHGTGYAYGRTDAWDANDFFSPKSPTELEQFGGSIGGPIKKDKLFFFANFESQNYNVGNSVLHKVPITAAGVGSAAQNLIGACLAAKGSATGLAPLSAQLAGLTTSCTPASNYPGLFPTNSGSDGLLINTSLSSVNKIYSGVTKIDFHLNDKNSISGMYFISPGNGTFVDNPTLEIAQPWLTVQSARSQVGSGNWVYTASPTLFNNLRVGYSHYFQVFQSNDATDNPANYMYNGSTYHINTGQTNPAYFGLPVFTFQGGYNFQLGLGWPKTVGPNGVYQFSDSVSILKGTHSIKIGAEYLINQSTNNVTANTKGPMRFSNLTAFFNGNMNRGLYTAGNLLRHLQDQAFAAYIQDDWRVTSRLTINAGLRYELTTVLKDNDNLLGNFVPGQGILQAGTSKLGSVFGGDHNNFAPRLGFAYDLAGNSKTVIRGAAGIYYSQLSFDSFMALGNLLGLRTVPTGVNIYTNGNATPFTNGGNINVGQITFTGAQLGSITQPGTVKYGYFNNSSNVPIYAAAPACGDGTVTVAATGQIPQPCSILGVSQNLRTPYVATWNLGIQRAITNNLSIEATYVGNHATKLLSLNDLNAPAVGAGWGSTSNPNSPISQCLASASSGYSNCNPSTSLENAARPFAQLYPYLANIYWLNNGNNSNYDGLQTALTQRTQHGVSYVIGYTWAHALAESPDNWSGLRLPVSGSQHSLYSSTQFDIRHRFTASVTYALPGIKSPAQMLKGWSLNSIVTVQTGTPWGVQDTTTDFSGTGEINATGSNGEQWNFYGNPNDFKTQKAFNNNQYQGIPYYSGTTNPACLAQAQKNGPAAVAALANLGCYANGSSFLIPPGFGTVAYSGNNLFRGPNYVNVDFSITKEWNIKEKVRAQFRAEAFNVFNHVNISNPQGGPGGDNTFTDPSATAGTGFGFRNETPDITSSNPVLGSGGPRAMQLGLKLIF